MATWRDDLSLAQARLAAFEAVEMARLDGSQVSKVQYDGGAVEYAQALGMDVLDRKIAEVRQVIARLSGCRRGGAIVPRLCG